MNQQKIIEEMIFTQKFSVTVCYCLHIVLQRLIPHMSMLTHIQLNAQKLHNLIVHILSYFMQISH